MNAENEISPAATIDRARARGAQERVGHADAHTRLYVRKARKFAQAEVERVQL